MRAEGWDAVAFGAKGIYWNALGNDRGENVGISDVGLVRNYDFDSTKYFISSPNIGSCDTPIIAEKYWDDHVIYRHKNADNSVDSGGWMPTSASELQGLLSANATNDSVRCADSVRNWISRNGFYNATHYWAPVMLPDNCGNSKWVAYFKGLPYIWNQFYWPASISSFNMWVPTFEGFKERWEAAKRFSKDIIPIAPTLAKLDWVEAFTYNERFTGAYSHSTSDTDLDRIHAAAAFAKFPLKDVKTNKINHYVIPLSPLNQFDSANTTLVELGLFTSSTDTSSKYIVVSNHRTWPLYYNANGSIDSSQGRLGAIDARQVRLTFDYKKFRDTTSIALYVKNMRTGKDTIIHRDSIYSIILEPGEGTLLKVGPAPSLTLGEMSTNLFNNARHIAPVELDNNSSPYSPNIKQYIATYQKNGKIVVSYPVETSSTFEKRHADTPIDSIVDGAGNCQNPSIAYSKLSNAIGLIYSSVISGPTADTNIVWFQRFNLATPYTRLVKTVLDTVVVVRGTDPFYTTPAIVPTNDTVHDFWVTWRAQLNKGGRVGLVDNNGILTSAAYFTAGTPSKTKFISPASHSGIANAHLAWEEYTTSGTHIFFIQAAFDAGFNVSVNSLKDLCTEGVICENHHPCIATDAEGSDHVTWEVYDALTINVKPRTLMYAGTSILRERDAATGRWSDFSEFFPTSGFTPVSLGALIPYNVYPTIASVGYAVAVDSEALFGNNKQWLDFTRISMNNSTSQKIDMVHLNFLTGYRWDGATMLEGSLEPAMAECSFWRVVPSAMLFRSPVLKDDGNFDAMMTRFKFPNTPVTQVPNYKLVWKVVKARPGGGLGCLIFKGGLDKTTIIHPGSNPLTVALHAREPQLTDTGRVPPPMTSPISWNDRNVRTEPFRIQADDTIRYRRFFALSNDFDTPDTTSLKNGLTDTADYMKARIYLRRLSDSSVITVLDTAMLKKAGFIRTGTDGDVEGQFIAPHVFTTDSMFITLEMIHGDTSNHWNLTLFDTYSLDNITSTLSFKQAAPTPRPQGSPGYVERIKVSVIPNPFQTSARITVDAPEEMFLNVSLYDELGRKVTELANGSVMQSHSEFTLTSQTLATGFYFLRVQSGGEVVTRKIQLLK